MKTRQVPVSLATVAFVLLFSHLAMAASVSGSNTGNVNIPDAGGYVSSTITISGAPAGATVTGIDVYFRCVHTYSGDLVVDLNADSTGSLGNRNLWNREGGAADNPTRTTTSITTFNGLSVNRTWYLYAKDFVSGDSGYIDEWTITVYYSDPIPPTPTGTSPGSTSSPGPTQASTTVTLSWNASSGATYYDLGVRDMATGNLIVDTTTSSTSYTVTLTAGKTYRWNVAAGNGSGLSSYTTPLYFQTPAAIPPTPTGTSPGSTSSPGPVQASTTVTLNWNASSGATYYDLGVRDMATDTLVVDTTTASTSYIVTLTAGKIYRWNVAAGNPSGLSSYTTPLYFQTPAAIPPTPTGTSPGLTSSPGPVQASTTVTLSWNTSSGATYYDLGVRDMATDTLVVDTTTTSTSYSATLAAGKIYRWNVAAGNASGLSSYTTPLYFQTPAAIPPTPTGTSPGSTSSPGPVQASITVALSWNASSGATYYDLGVRDMATDTLVVDTTTASTSYSATLAAGKIYRWNVAAGNPSGLSSYTTPLYFQTPGTGGGTVLLPGSIGYIRQINNSDMHPAFNSANACGPCSAVMILTYYNRLTAHPMVGQSGQNNDYSWYVAPVESSVPSSTAYSSKGFTFNVGTPDVVGGTINYGAFGYLTQDFQSDPQTRADRAVQFLWKNGLFATFANAASESDVRAEIDAGRPVFLSAQFSTGGHIMVIRGYNPTQLIAADPWVRADLANRDQYAYTWSDIHYDGAAKWIVKSITPIAAGGRVRAASSFNVRVQPSTSAGTSGAQRTSGQLGTILHDATLNSTFWNADGFTWAKVQWDDDQVIGWSAIGSSDTLWIEPISTGGGDNPSSPVISSPKLIGTTFTLNVPSESGFNYVLEYKNTLNDANWIAVQTNSGSGGTIGLTNNGATGPSRIYRVRVQ